MNDRRSDDPDPYGNRSWEEFLRNVRREESGTSDDDEPERAPADDEGSQEERAPRAGPGARPPGDARVVVPPETEFEGAHRRRRRLLIGGAAALALLVGAFLVYDQVVAGRDGGAAVNGQGRAAAGAEEGSARFAARADSLAEAIAGFRERRRDFELGRIGCEGLTRGHREVRSTFADLRSVAAEDGALLAPPSRERFQRLVGDVRSVEEAFAESGCTGPS